MLYSAIWQYVQKNKRKKEGKKMEREIFSKNFTKVLIIVMMLVVALSATGVSAQGEDDAFVFAVGACNPFGDDEKAYLCKFWSDGEVEYSITLSTNLSARPSVAMSDTPSQWIAISNVGFTPLGGVALIQNSDLSWFAAGVESGDKAFIDPENYNWINIQTSASIPDFTMSGDSLILHHNQGCSFYYPVTGFTREYLTPSDEAVEQVDCDTLNPFLDDDRLRNGSDYVDRVIDPTTGQEVPGKFELYLTDEDGVEYRIEMSAPYNASMPMWLSADTVVFMREANSEDTERAYVTYNLVTPVTEDGEIEWLDWLQRSNLVNVTIFSVTPVY